MAEEILRLENVGFEAGGQQILKKMNYDEAAAFAPYKIAMEKRMKIVA